MQNQQKSVIYNLSSSAPSSSRMSTSSFTPPFYIVSSEFDNNSEIYDEIQDSNVKGKKAVPIKSIKLPRANVNIFE